MTMQKIVTCKRLDPETNQTTHLANPVDGWGPRQVEDVIADIENNKCEYRSNSIKGAILQVINGSTGTFLRSRPDDTIDNNLRELPICQ